MTPKFRMRKIVVVGPTKAGKSTIANYLGETKDVELLGEYVPTKALRILEFESHELEHELEGQKVEVDIDLWDCSGDLKYSDCWPAIREKCEGVVLVANPDEHQGSDLDLWYKEFIAKEQLDVTCRVLVILNEMGDRRTNDSAISDFKLPSSLSQARIAVCNLKHQSDSLRLEFNQFLVDVIESTEKND